MAEEAATMPMDFFNNPELAYYKLGGELDTCRIIVGTWQLDGRHGYHPFFMSVFLHMCMPVSFSPSLLIP